MPNYNDPNDAIANAIIANLYPNRIVVGIDLRNLYENGGMVHCVTQQQPTATLSINKFDLNQKFEAIPNPVKNNFQIKSEESIDEIEIYNELGQQVFSKNGLKFNEYISVENLNSGIYFIKIYSNESNYTLKIIKQ